LNSPFLLAKKNSAMLAKTKIYFDCGTEDSYGFNRGASEMDQALNSLKIPHEFHLYPGGHSVSYLSPTGRPRTNSTGACLTRRTNLKTFHIDARCPSAGVARLM